MKFKIKCEVECDEKMLGDTINGIVSRGNGRILDIKQADDAAWMRNTAPARPDDSVPNVHKISLSVPPHRTIGAKHPAIKLEVYEAIIKHGRIGQVRKAEEWNKYINKCTQRNYGVYSFAKVLNVLAQLGLMRKVSRGYYVLDAILPVENAKGMIENFNREHKAKYKNRSKPTKNWGNIFAS